MDSGLIVSSGVDDGERGRRRRGREGKGREEGMEEGGGKEEKEGRKKRRGHGWVNRGEIRGVRKEGEGKGERER